MSEAVGLSDLIDVTRSGFDILIKSTMEANAPSSPSADSPTKKGKGAMDLIGKSITGALGPMTLLATIMESFLEPVELITDPLSEIGTIFSELLYPILTPIAGVLYLIMPYLSAFTGYLTPFLNFLFSAQGAMFLLTTAGAFLVGVVTDVGIWFQNLGSTISDGFWNIINWFGNLGTTIWTAITNGFWIVINWFTNLPQLILDAIINGATSLGTGVSNWWNSLWD